MKKEIRKNNNLISGVVVKELKLIPDERGFLMEILRCDDEIFEKFGQVYLTSCKKGVAKGWHYHKKQEDYFVCLFGKALVVLYDLRKNSSTYKNINEFILEAPQNDKSKPILLKIPKLVVHGFTAIDYPEARIVNIPTLTYNYKNPDEFRFPWDTKEIPYKWPSFVKFGG